MTREKSATPMMDQYLRLKAAHPDAILLFRLGDFYEMFYEDARTASPILEIALTSRQKVPMCGVPHHAVESYIAKLLRRGFKVAVSEQLEDPKKAKGVVKRDVIKVLTPGTAVEVDLEGGKDSVTIAGLYRERRRLGTGRHRPRLRPAADDPGDGPGIEKPRGRALPSRPPRRSSSRMVTSLRSRSWRGSAARSLLCGVRSKLGPSILPRPGACCSNTFR